jgi:hypothetical protein
MSQKHRILGSFASLALAVSLGACSMIPAAQPAETTTTVVKPADNEGTQYVLYVGTNDKDTNQPVFPPEECKQKAKDILIQHLGGYTIQEAEGGWVSDDGTAYQEYTLVIHLSDTSLALVHDVCDEFIKTFNQSSILIQEYKTGTEFYDGTQKSTLGGGTQKPATTEGTQELAPAA